MGKRKIALTLLAVFIVTGLLVAILPGGVGAAPPTGIVEVNWSEAAFEGTDAFHGTGVVAYKAGSTAKLEFRVWNDSAADLNIRGGKVTFDWGTCTPVVPAAFPFVLKAGEYAIFRFECVVPADATNQTLHSYKVAVEYEGMGGPTAVSRTNWEEVDDSPLTPAGNDLNDLYPFPGSVTLWDVTATGPLVISGDKYAVDYTNGEITWLGTYTGPSGTLYASYDYIAMWTQGNGTNKVFRFQTDATKLPIVADSVKVCKRVDAPVSSITKVDTGWTVDAEAGTVTFTDAPAAYEFVGVFYKYYSSFVQTGNNFAVYSADQADAQALSVQLDNLDANEPDAWLPTSTAGAQAKAESDVLAAQAATKYAAGDFAGAKADYQAAVDKLNAAYTATTGLNTTLENGVAGLLTGAGGVVDAYGAKLNAEAKHITDTTKAEANKLNAEASFSKNLGVFMILFGVATLLAGIGGILWAYSRLVAARVPRQM